MGLLGHRSRALMRKAVPGVIRRRIRDTLRKKSARVLETAKKEAIDRYGWFEPDELFRDLKIMGIQRGGILLVQSSFGRFHNFSGTSEDLLSVLEQLVGAEGTMMMPAHPHYRENGPFIFNVCKSPAKTGLLCELFRRRPGVFRSLHPTHSVCARGPLARELLSDHHKDPLSCGPLSPYAKLAEYGGEILGLGLPPGYTTFFHVVEDMNIKTYPRRLYADRVYEFTIIDETGRQLFMKLQRRDRGTGKRMNLPRLVQHLSEESHRTFSIRGIPCFKASATPLLKELQSLTKQEILLYD